MFIQTSRLSDLNSLQSRPGGHYVLYWMQQSQRSAFNPALEFAIGEANALGLPVVVGFGIDERYPEANARHYAFMLQGLAELSRDLARRGIAFVIRRGTPDAVALELGRTAALVVCDRGYLRHQRAWRARVARRAGCRVVQAEGDVVVPVEVASTKHEVGARTLRPKLHRVWDEYIAPLPETPVRRTDGANVTSELDLRDVSAALADLDVDRSVAPVRRFGGGLSAARDRLSRFLEDGLECYARNRGRPEAGAVSQLSPYLHFGQISPVEIVLAVREARRGGAEDRSAYIEELVVRRELAANHCYYDHHYDGYDAVPEWARRTLDAHRSDPRPHLYSSRQLEAGDTHDVYWNAAMKEMRETGYMHNRMRMYWGKKILEWSAEPEQGFATTLFLNNRYLLDGRDPNSYANVAWLYGLHDRPWFRRPIFGNVRPMGRNSLKAFDADAYLREVDDLATMEST